VKNVRSLALIILTFLFAQGSARAQSPAPAAGPSAPVQFASFGDFKLQSGEAIRDFHLGYRTLGTLNAARSNAILWPTWLDAKSEELLPYAGPGNVADTSKYFVILVDAIGNGVSTSPSNSRLQPRMKFPKFSIQDMVESEYRLATETLQLTHLHAVMGISMGGMQTFAWAVTHPDFMDLAVPMAGSPQSTSYDKLLWTSEIDAVELDPAWNHGNPTRPLTSGVAVAEEIDSMNVTTPGYRVDKTSAEEFDPFIGGLKNHSKADGGSVSDWIRQRQAIISLDLPRDLGMSLNRIAARARGRILIIVSTQDHMVNPRPAMQFAAAVGAPLIELDSACGHLSFTCISVGPLVAQFLADPTSVHSQTLHETPAH
jgi:homoserine O-acetyltransferase